MVLPPFLDEPRGDEHAERDDFDHATARNWTATPTLAECRCKPCVLTSEGVTMDIQFVLNDDRTIAKFALQPFAADAAELSALIEMLAQVRDKMTPSIRSVPPTAPPRWAIDNPSWAVFTGHAPGTLSVVLSHPGYGWLRFDLPAKEAQDIAGALEKNLGKIPPPQATH